jgi:hypothetical protein
MYQWHTTDMALLPHKFEKVFSAKIEILNSTSQRGGGV